MRYFQTVTTWPWPYFYLSRQISVTYYAWMMVKSQNWPYSRFYTAKKVSQIRTLKIAFWFSITLWLSLLFSPTYCQIVTTWPWPYFYLSKQISVTYYAWMMIKIQNWNSEYPLNKVSSVTEIWLKYKASVFLYNACICHNTITCVCYLTCIVCLIY